ncbi:carboxypeptidase-like regulatory domain-containing protein [Tundrisphaera lichenicola]|uniref:carboxypeptidase-like regulatory domain-containing protein n=1 Tax=Tundrisphaera lichenicola TaxID=2029860 RepID=UPI003EB86CDD
MDRRVGIWCLVSLLGCAVSVSGADDPGRSGMIVGRLVDLQGRPVVGGSVWGSAWGTSARVEVGRTQSDGEGRFQLGPISDEKPVDVWFEADGLARERRDAVHVFEGRGHDLGALTLITGTRLVGHVVDSAGHPVSGAKVSIEVYRRVLGHTISSDQAKWDIQADAEGRFVSTGLPPGEGQLMIAAPSKVRTSLSRRTVPGTAEIDLGEIKLEDEVPIRGVVVDQDGKPAPKVEVVADYDHENKVFTDEEGRFIVGGAGKDSKTILLMSNDYFATKPFPIGADRDHLRLEVRRAFTISASAVDAETGAPVEVDSVRLCMVTHEPDGTTSLRG